MGYVALIVGFWDSDNEPSGSIKRGEFLDCERMYSFLNKVSPPLNYLVSYSVSQLVI